MPGTITERTASQRKTRVGEIVPLTAEQSDLLASLYEEYGSRLVRYAYSQLRKWDRVGGDVWTLAEDIAQGTWVQVAREGARGPLGEASVENMGGLLFYRVRQEISRHFKLYSTGEKVVDFADPVTCNWLCPMMPSGCSLVELPAYLAAMVEALPEQERAALLLMLDGLDPRSMAEHLGCGDTAAVLRARAAVLRLQIDNPELSREPVALASLPEWERRALSELSPARREALLRLESSERQALLLKEQGLSKREISERLGLSHDAVAAVIRCVSTPRAARKPRATGRRANSKFAQVADALREDIKAMRPGDRLPRRVDLMARFAVGSRTIDNAWAVLRGEGLIESNGLYGYSVTRNQDDMEQAA
ncbi:GntR family transcriptional regulator [Streptomyces althioticus]|uniref:GntR family transcriptional regulator n=1 Tax=Streptomyces TaxID=1883 RepID=UPI001E3D4C96|nr:GntR family transcriptional regulator [Actinospica acidiphila]MCC9688150.1 GntR family transcriptional regulator [Streptomyces sp. MNU103]